MFRTLRINTRFFFALKIALVNSVFFFRYRTEQSCTCNDFVFNLILIKRKKVVTRITLNGAIKNKTYDLSYFLNNIKIGNILVFR